MRRTAFAAILSLLSVATATAQPFPQTFPDHTVVGRLGTGSSSGPWQAIPFNALAIQLFNSGANTVLCNATATPAAPIGCSTLPSGLTIPSPTVSGTATFTGTIVTNPTSTTASAIYSAINSTGTFTDLNQTVMSIAAAASQDQYSAVSAYFTSASGGSGSTGNAIGLFAAGLATANNSDIWGANTLLQDNSTRATGSLTGITMIGHEADFNVMNTGTTIIGFTVGGNSLAQPTNANGYTVNSLGNGNVWTGSFVSSDGASDVALVAGALATSGSSISSQPIYMKWFDSGGTERVVTLQIADAFLSITSTGTFNGVSVGSGNMNIASGNSYEIDSTPVVYLSGTTTQLSLSGTLETVGSAAFVNTGTSGATVPLLSAANTWSGIQTLSKPLALEVYTIAGLPSCGSGQTGYLAFVSDTTASTTATYHGTVTGSGSSTVNSPVSCNGSNWQYD